MEKAPIFATRVDIADGPDTTLVIFSGPAGPVADGCVMSLELVRLVMTNKTLVAIADAFHQKSLLLAQGASQSNEAERVARVTRELDRQAAKAEEEPRAFVEVSLLNPH